MELHNYCFYKMEINKQSILPKGFLQTSQKTKWGVDNVIFDKVSDTASSEVHSPMGKVGWGLFQRIKDCPQISAQQQRGRNETTSNEVQRWMAIRKKNTFMNYK